MKTARALQKGATMWQMTFYVVFFLFVITALLKLVPLYMDDHNVATAINGVREQIAGRDVYEVTNTDIRSRLSKFFQVSMLPSELLKEVDVVREGGTVLLKLDYERRVELMGNVDVVLRFSHEVDLAEPPKK